MSRNDRQKRPLTREFIPPDVCPWLTATDRQIRPFSVPYGTPMARNQKVAQSDSRFSVAVGPTMKRQAGEVSGA